MRTSTLAILGALALMAGWSVPSNAVEVCAGYSSYGNGFSCCSQGNCTWWARYMRPDVQGVCTSNAKNWLTQAASGNFQTSTTPVAGSIAVFPNQTAYGHVAYVLSVNSNNSFYVSEMGCDSWNGVRYKTYGAGSASGFILWKETAVNTTTAQQKINACRNANSWLGNVVSGGGFHEWHPSGGNGRWVYIVDYQAGSVVYDMIGGASQAFAVPSYFMAPWAADRGCAGSNLGCPIGNRYGWNSGTRQDFENGYLFYKSGVNIGPYTWNGSRSGPGILQYQKRSHLFSYKVGDCYSRNGGRNRIGLPLSSLPHLHPVAPFSALIQDFSGGSWSSPIIIYDTQASLYANVVYPHLPSGNSMNQACELHGAFRNYWEANGRFTGVGYPFTDEYPNNGITCQRFIKRTGGRWIGTELRYQNGSVTAHQFLNQQIQGEEPDIDVVHEMESSVAATEPGLVQQPMMVSPNPMRTSALIICRIPSASDLKLEVFDASGRMVRRLANVSDHPAGQFQFDWDARSDEGHQVSTGVYFVRLALADQIQTQRMVLVR